MTDVIQLKVQSPEDMFRFLDRLDPFVNDENYLVPLDEVQTDIRNYYYIDS